VPEFSPFVDENGFTTANARLAIFFSSFEIFAWALFPVVRFTILPKL